VLKLEVELGAVKVREGIDYVDPRHGDWPDWRKTWLVVLIVEMRSLVEHPVSDLGAILEMVQDKKISADEAERLIAAL
jgi:hypothetical protein